MIDYLKIVDKSHCGTGYTKESFQDIDGLITNQSGVALVTQYADCTPLIFCDPVKKVIATSHSGWRGTVKEIGKLTVEKMMREFGSDPADISHGAGGRYLAAVRDGSVRQSQNRRTLPASPHLGLRLGCDHHHPDLQGSRKGYCKNGANADRHAP